MPVGFGKHAINSMGRQLSVLALLKKGIVEVKAEENCLAYGLVIAIVKLDKDSNYDAFVKVGRYVPWSKRY